MLPLAEQTISEIPFTVQSLFDDQPTPELVEMKTQPLAVPEIKIFASADIATVHRRLVLAPMIGVQEEPEFVERKSGFGLLANVPVPPNGALLANTVIPSADTATLNCEFVIGVVVGAQEKPALVET